MVTKSLWNAEELSALAKESELTPQRIKELGDEYLFPAYLRYWPDDPLYLGAAGGQYVYGLGDGRQYLDMFGSVVTISAGHCHPEIVEAICAQVRRAQHFTTLFPEPNLVLASEALAKLAPVGLKKTFWVNTGGEANTLAMHIAKRATKRTGVVALLHSFHGRTEGPAALTFQQPWRNVPPYMGDVYPVPNPYDFRKPREMSEDGFYNWCLEYTRQVVLHACGGANLAAIWIEPIQGNGGVIYGPDWYYDALVKLAHEVGGLVISDEVQTGVGRTGKMWGCSHWSELPDIMVMAKGLGNGHPIGAVTTTEKVAKDFGSLTHFNTYGGNPVSMMAARKTLEIVAREETRDNIADRGIQLRDGLEGLMEKHPLIGEVRGRGLMLGLEIVNPKDNSPNPTAAVRIHRLCRDHGVLLGKGGVAHTVFRVKPPYCITREDCDAFINVLDESLAVVERGA